MRGTNNVKVRVFGLAACLRLELYRCLSFQCAGDDWLYVEQLKVF